MTEEESRQLKSEEAREVLQKAYYKCFSGDAGKMVLADLEKACGYNSSVVHYRTDRQTNTPLPIDPLQTHVNAGKQMVMSHIINYIGKGKCNE